ncbi:MAG TPA: trypsin-like peptidase domain-containing protein [Verrucomicrobiae bacterium]|jgi:serine protease Do|nr:trypsin-like peptidase domain-containing protein [Verrucomicrobiae bacterium]
MKTIKTTLFCALAAAVVVAGAGLAAAKDASPLDLARQLNEAFIQVADQASPAVVVIEITGKTTQDDSDDSGSFLDALPPEVRRYFEDHAKRHKHPHKFSGEGSGIIVSADGYILTNNHVVEDADKIVVRFKDGRVYDGEVKGTDPESDLAVVKIKASGLTPAKLGDSDATRVGEFVLAIGAPFTLSYSVTFGHVSAKGRSFEGETGNYADQDFIQTDASINPGNSGGPLVNLYGEVIAINTMIEGMNTGIGFAIPVNLAKRVMAHLIDEGKYSRAWLGIGIGDLRDDPDYSTLDSKLAPDVKDGVLVKEVFANGPATKSDLRPGDVITAVDAKSIKTSRQLKEEIEAEKPGHVIVLDVVRARQHLPIKVTVAALPTAQEMAGDTETPRPQTEAPSLGLTVEAMSKESASQYGIDQIPGVIVTAVEEDSPAQERGIQPGDVITEINRKRITTPRQFREALRSADKKAGMMISLSSNGANRFVVLKADGE